MLVIPYRIYKKCKLAIENAFGISAMKKRLTALTVHQASLEELLCNRQALDGLRDELDVLRSSIENSGNLSLPTRSRTNTTHRRAVSRTPQYVFVCGLHRSGTTLLSRLLAMHQEVTSFHNTLVPEDEGQFLQTVFPSDRDLGKPGLFGFLKESHLTEDSHLVSQSNREKLLRQWSLRWDLARNVRLEKSPSNLLRTRFLQAMFPGSKFIVLRRHPVANALAVRKWARAMPCTLIRHWLMCYDTWERDKERISHSLEIRYEDFVHSPSEIINQIWAFIGIDASLGSGIEKGLNAVRSDVNGRYFEEWKRNIIDRRLCETLFESNINKHGYSLHELNNEGGNQ